MVSWSASLLCSWWWAREWEHFNLDARPFVSCRVNIVTLNVTNQGIVKEHPTTVAVSYLEAVQKRLQKVVHVAAHRAEMPA